MGICRDKHFTMTKEKRSVNKNTQPFIDNHVVLNAPSTHRMIRLCLQSRDLI